MNQKITILYATMTGNARDCAHHAAARLNRDGHTVVVADLAKYVASDILAEQVVLVCISTWGDGEPPDDAIDFVDYLRALEAGALSDLKYSVLALGDTCYDQFCQCGKEIDERLETLGAERIAPRVDCDVDFEEHLHIWASSVASMLNLRQELA